MKPRCQDNEIKIPTIFKSTYFWAVNKRPKSHFNEIFDPSAASRWEPLHRLDFETSGILLFGLKEHASQLRSIFKENPLTQKLYIVGASKIIPSGFEGTELEGFIGERYRSSKKVKFSFDKTSFRSYRNVRKALQIIEKLKDKIDCPFSGNLYKVQIKTGVRHQIRALFTSMGAPLVGDDLYEGPPASRLELHSWKLNFTCPLTGATYTLEAPFEEIATANT